MSSKYLTLVNVEFSHFHVKIGGLELLFSLKPKEMDKMRLLAIWIDKT